MPEIQGRPPNQDMVTAEWELTKDCTKGVEVTLKKEGKGTTSNHTTDPLYIVKNLSFSLCRLGCRSAIHRLSTT